jgi:hypothetical protein
MMSEVELPALHAYDPLGFLAAIGVLRLATEHFVSPPALSWSVEPKATAILHLEGALGLDGVIELIARIRDDLLAEHQRSGAVLPRFVEPFPEPKRTERGRGSDPLKMSRNAYRELALRAQQDELAGDPRLGTWLPAFLSDLGSVQEEGEPPARTAFYLLTQQMTMHQQFVEALTASAAEPDGARRALTRWRRLPGFVGAHLDYRARRTAAESPSADAVNSGVPGATWLALMGLPMFAVVGDGRSGRTKGWRGPEGGGGERLVWPRWSVPLDLWAVRVLLDSPLLAIEREGRRVRLAGGFSRLGRLGIVEVYASRKIRVGEKNTPVIGPAERLAR